MYICSTQSTIGPFTSFKRLRSARASQLLPIEQSKFSLVDLWKEKVNLQHENKRTSLCQQQMLNKVKKRATVLIHTDISCSWKTSHFISRIPAPIFFLYSIYVLQVAKYVDLLLNCPNYQEACCGCSYKRRMCCRAQQ